MGGVCRKLILSAMAMAALGCECGGPSRPPADPPSAASPIEEGGSPIAAPTDRYAEQRRQMVERQLRRRDISDPRVLAAMGKVPRHRFVPLHLRLQAHVDHALPIGREQTISQPYIVAFMSQALRLEGDERVLEVGTGSGYQAAVLAELCREVYTIEIIPELARSATALLRELGYENIQVRSGDGYQGWPDRGPFDAIMVTAAPDHVPQPLLDQLAPGGRMILPVGDRWQNLVLIERSAEGELSRRRILPVVFVPMTGEAQRHR